MASKYTYSISDDTLNGTVNIDGLIDNIADSSIVTEFSHINTEADDCDIWFDTALSQGEWTTLSGVVAAHTGVRYTHYSNGDLDYYLDDEVITVDPYTTISGQFLTMQVLLHRRELYNDPENALYLPGHQPILGVSGTIVDTQNRVLNLETILNKNGWYTQLAKERTYTRPHDLLIYYGWLNSFNSAENGWSNEAVAQDMAKYEIIVFGDGIQDPGHGDFTNASGIISRIKTINPNTMIFGYVTVDQTQGNFETKAGQWDDLGVYGIFMDEAGYDYGTTRSGLNERIDFVHNQSSANKCFVNAWAVDHIIGTENDATYPNTTYNPNLDESNLTQNDWYLLESFPINTTAYTTSTPDGYESRTDWAYRGSRAIINRNTYAINVAAVGIIANNNSIAQDLFDFGYTSSLMWSLEAFGTSDTSYAASSAKVDYWSRPDVYKLENVWSLSPTVVNDVSDSDLYYRYIRNAKLKLDFSTSAQDFEIEYYTPEASSPGATSSGVDVEKDGVAVSGSPFNTLNFAGFDTVEQEEAGTVTISGGGGGSSAAPEISSMMGNTDVDYVEEGGTVNVVARSFYYTGTGDWTPTTWGIVASRGGTATTGYARLYDVTNSQEIATLSWTDEAKAYYSTSSLSNLPSSAAIIEVQYRSSTNNRYVRIHYMILK